MTHTSGPRPPCRPKSSSRKGTGEGRKYILQFTIMFTTPHYAVGHANPYEVKPSYSWAPWMGKDVRGSELLLNTEHRKCHRDEDDRELKRTGNSGNREVTEGRLVELLHGNKVRDYLSESQ